MNISQVRLTRRSHKNKKKMQTPPLVFTVLIWTPASVSASPGKLDMQIQKKVFPQRETKKKNPPEERFTPSAPAQDAPAYKKAQAATLRRVNGGRHLGDSPAERVSLWK